jgi:diguanylate cyclase (GGDEF)-like protein
MGEPLRLAPYLPTEKAMEAVEGDRGVTTRGAPAGRQGFGFLALGRYGGERGRAREQAHWLVKDLQDDVPGAAAETTALLAQARASGWPEVVRAAMYADAVGAMVAWDGRFHDVVTALRQQSELDGDPVMEALALGLGSWQGIGGEDPELALAADRDLARATVILELAEGLEHCDPYERASAHIAAGVSYAYRRLWELEDEQYQAAERVLVPGQEKFLGAVVAFNRAELQMRWACALRELGEQGQLELHCGLGRQAVETAMQLDMPRTWRTGLTTMELVFRTLSGEDIVEEAQRLGTEEPRDYELYAHLPLAAALSDASYGRRRSCLENAARALAALDAVSRPTEHDLALFLLAEQHEPLIGGPSPAFQYARRQVRLRWQSRLSSLASMRSLVEGERLRGEHALLRRHAFFDDLTGLANRRELHRFTTLAAARGTDALVMMVCDVDRFKEINDTWGHYVGDRVLVELASLLARSVRSGDLAARLGGDEFVLVLDGLDLEAAEPRAAAIVRDVADRPWSAIQPGLHVAVSIGLAAGAPGRADELLRKADAALYEAKAAGGSRWALAS